MRPRDTRQRPGRGCGRVVCFLTKPVDGPGRQHQQALALLGGQKEGGTGWRKPRCQARADAGKACQAHCLGRPHCKQIPGSSEGRISLGVLSTREHKLRPVSR